MGSGISGGDARPPLSASGAAVATAAATASAGLAADPFLTSLDLSAQWNVPLPIAEQLLLVRA
jgi:hypothetical protein